MLTEHSYSSIHPFIHHSWGPGRWLSGKGVCCVPDNLSLIPKSDSKKNQPLKLIFCPYTFYGMHLSTVSLSLPFFLPHAHKPHTYLQSNLKEYRVHIKVPCWVPGHESLIHSDCNVVRQILNKYMNKHIITNCKCCKATQKYSGKKIFNYRELFIT